MKKTKLLITEVIIGILFFIYYNFMMIGWTAVLIFLTFDRLTDFQINNIGLVLLNFLLSSIVVSPFVLIYFKIKPKIFFWFILTLITLVLTYLTSRILGTFAGRL